MGKTFRNSILVNYKSPNYWIGTDYNQEHVNSTVTEISVTAGDEVNVQTSVFMQRTSRAQALHNGVGGTLEFTF